MGATHSQTPQIPLMQVTMKSELTGNVSTREIAITPGQFQAWIDNLCEGRRRKSVQQMFPDLSADDREFLMTGVTPEEWNDAFGPVIDDDGIDLEAGRADRLTEYPESPDDLAGAQDYYPEAPWRDPVPNGPSRPSREHYDTVVEPEHNLKPVKAYLVQLQEDQAEWEQRMADDLHELYGIDPSDSAREREDINYYSGRE